MRGIEGLRGTCKLIISRRNIPSMNTHSSDLPGIVRGYGRRLSAILIICALFFSGCDEAAVRQVGAKVGMRGQDVSSAAITALSNLADLEAVDYSQRTVAAIIVQPPQTLNTLPTVEHNDQLLEQIQLRIAAYRQFGKAYAALHRLSETAFADQAEAAQTELVNSVNAIKNIPDLPASVSSLIPAVTGLIVDRKQAREIKKHNQTLHRLSEAYKALWVADRPTWNAYLERVRGAYVNSLNSVPVDRFDEKKLREVTTMPYTSGYLANLFKAQEAARLDQNKQQLIGQVDAVDEAFRLLVISHKELASQKPSYSDVIAYLDRIVTVLQDVKNKS